jgi:hypothetical protein
MNLPPHVMKINCVIGKKYAPDTNIITHVGGGVHNFTFMVHIDQQYSRFSVKKWSINLCHCIIILKKKITVQIEKKI